LSRKFGLGQSTQGWGAGRSQSKSSLPKDEKKAKQRQITKKVKNDSILYRGSLRLAKHRNHLKWGPPNAKIQLLKRRNYMR